MASGSHDCYGCGCVSKVRVSKTFSFRDANGAKVTAERCLCHRCLATFSSLNREDLEFARSLEERVWHEVIPS